MKKLNYCTSFFGFLLAVFTCTDIIRINNYQVININDISSDDTIDSNFFNELISQAKNDGLDGISFTYDIIKPERIFPQSW